MMRAYVQVQASCTRTLPVSMMTPFGQKKRAAALGVVRAVAACEEMLKAKDSTEGFKKVLGITRRVEETVFPAPASEHPALHKLSKLDHLFPTSWSVPLLLFFTADACGGVFSEEEIVRTLKRSLSQVLAIFYPMAGRLVQRSDDSTYFDVSCLDQGALFSEAWADCPLSIFQPDFQPHPSFHLLTSLAFSYEPNALLYIQVTHFTCGGFCISMQERHILSDGVSFYHFLKSWVEILNGKSGLTLYPHMDLSILEDGYKVNNLLTPSSQYDDNFLETSPIDFDTQKKLTFTSKIFHFTPNFIANIRDDAKLVRNPTSYECIVAYIWQNLTRVQQYSPNARTKLSFSIDIRKRLRPCLPPGYFGNALLRAFAYAKVEDLVAKEGLSYAMSLVRDATSSIKSDFTKLALDWLGKQQSVPPLYQAPSQDGAFFNTWTRMPFSDLNFPWGKPYCHRTHFDPNSIGEFVLILPSHLGKGHLDVLIILQNEKMVKFQDLII